MPLTQSQIVVQVCLVVFAAIALCGGSLQFYLGQPETSPKLDNVHRFMAGVYFWLTYLIPELVLPIVVAVAHSLRP